MIKVLYSDFTKSKNKRIFELLLHTNSSIKEYIFKYMFFE